MLFAYFGRTLTLVVWEDYGLFHEIDPFLRRLPEHEADVALREAAKIIAELRIAGLGHQLGKARDLRTAAVAAAESFMASTEAGDRHTTGADRRG